MNFKFKFKFNDRSALLDIFGKLDDTSTGQIKKFYVSIQTFPNTTALLQYMYITYIILMFLLASRRT